LIIKPGRAYTLFSSSVIVLSASTELEKASHVIIDFSKTKFIEFMGTEIWQLRDKFKGIGGDKFVLCGLDQHGVRLFELLSNSWGVSRIDSFSNMESAKSYILENRVNDRSEAPKKKINVCNGEIVDWSISPNGKYDITVEVVSEGNIVSRKASGWAESKRIRDVVRTLGKSLKTGGYTFFVGQFNRSAFGKLYDRILPG
jgi:hypothetical protein